MASQLRYIPASQVSAMTDTLLTISGQLQRPSPSCPSCQEPVHRFVLQERFVKALEIRGAAPNANSAGPPSCLKWTSGP
jgi:hypothetical protein